VGGRGTNGIPQYIEYFIILNEISKQEGKTGPVWGVSTSRSGEDLRKGCGSVNMYSCMKMEK
jgi:hypothetical protein